ncbi:MAG: TonB-dependent receptor [Alphaproteobacteria bacterium]|nr:TonB-dependent receptor [Alphaproteobacteria bacterium]
MRHLILSSTALFAVLAPTALAQAPQQDAAPADASSRRDVVVITGSFIAGTAEDAALPVDVFTTEDLQNQGSPTLVQLVKTLPAFSGGALGEANRFVAVAAGTATLNLRGLGAARTLVLLNGQRVAGAAFQGVGESADINHIPLAAIGRIEVLKDGAAATYGSDAIGGVVNFITRNDFDGIEFDAEYALIDGSDGDYYINGAYGGKFDKGDYLLTAGYRVRSKLDVKERDWSLRTRAANPNGGWTTASNPGTYTALTSRTDADGDGGFEAFAAAPAGNSFVDRGCVESGSVLASATSCSFQFTAFDNIVNPEEHYQAYGEFNYDFSDALTLHAEALWSKREVIEDASVYQSTTQFPAPIEASGGSAGGGVSPIPASGLNEQSLFYIPGNHPGLQAVMSPCPYSAAICANSIANGVVTSQTLWRPGGVGGNPRNLPDGSTLHYFNSEAVRVSGGLQGELSVFNGVNWDFNLTYSKNSGETIRTDRSVNRLQLALRGFGSNEGASDQCTTAEMTAANAGNNAVGCYWFNPFTSGVETFLSNGTTNPFFRGAALANSADLVRWIERSPSTEIEQTLYVADLVFSGDLGLSFPAGPVKYAVGGQTRTDEFSANPNDVGDPAITPCVDSAPFGDGLPTCRTSSGPFIFLPPVAAQENKRTVDSLFAELQLPLLDNLDVTLAVRAEDYGGQIGTTTNPKVAFKWMPTEWMSFRGSAGTTFRAPIASFITSDFSRSNNQFINPLGGSLYRTVDTFGNPNLQPETADTYNIGVLFDFDDVPVVGGGLRSSLDYFNFVLKDEITIEAAGSVYATMFPNATPANWQCANAALAARFTFANGVCNPNNFLGVKINRINGAGVDLSGVDFSIAWDQTAMGWLGGGDLSIGLDGTYLIEYARADLKTVEGIVISPAIDRVGKYDLINQFFSYPELRGNVFINWSLANHNVRWTTNYASSTEATTPGVAFRPEDTIYHNLTYLLNVFDRTDLTLTVKNLFDDGPPFYRGQYNYDYTQGEPLGRVFEFGIKTAF